MIKKHIHSLAHTSAILSALLMGLPCSGFAESLQRSTLLEQAVHLSSNEVKTKVVRVTFPPAFKTPLHTHEGPGPRYVVKG